jgi:DNA-binding NarL/FixJ family response regulator
MARQLNSPSVIRLFLVDDEPVVRRGLRLLFSHEPGLEVCGEAGTELEALEGILSEQPDLAIVDLSLKEGDGLALIKRLHRLRPTTKILVFSMHEQEHFVATSLAAGAHGYVLKDEGTDQVLQAIQEVMKGKCYLSPRMAAKVARPALHSGPGARTHKP